MPMNKIILNNEVLIDLTTDTVTQNDVKKGVTFHGRDGVEYEGTYEVSLESKEIIPSQTQQVVIAGADYEGLEKVTVEPIPSEYIVPTGEMEVKENNTYDVTQFASIKVDIPIPDGYVKPSGSIEITEGGTYDVTNYESVEVDIPDSPLPTEVSTEEEMTALLESAEIGSVYKYMGTTTDAYENGALYVVEESE